MRTLVKAVRLGKVHYHAGCDECDFSAAIQTHQTGTAQDVLNAVRKHVRRTGHHCWVESGSVTHYSRVEDYSS